jgi:hypothetical protein
MSRASWARAIVGGGTTLAVVATASLVAPSAAWAVPTVPGIPTGVQASVTGDRTLHVVWTAPVDPGEGPVDHYPLQAAVGSLGTFVAVPGGTCAASVDVASTMCDATGLAAGGSYRFEVTAVNNVGSSDPSAPSTGVVAITFPNAPGTPVASVLSEGTVHVEWAAPTITSGRPVSSYAVQMKVDSGSSEVIDSGGCSGTVAGLSCDQVVATGHQYSFEVFAHNAVGAGATSGLSNAIDPVAGPAATKLADLNGDGRADLISFDTFGAVQAFGNLNGMGANTYGTSVLIGSAGWNPARTWFTDISGDGKADAVYIDSGGTVHAVQNVGGLTTTVFAGAPITVGTTWNPADTAFADINGDGRAEIIYFDGSSNVWAFRNNHGLRFDTFDSGATKIGEGWDKTKTAFADLNGDGKSEIIDIASSGVVTAYRNNNGLNGATFGAGLAIGSGGWTPSNTRFADLTGDRKAEIVYISGGNLTAFRNVNGLSSAPFADSNMVAAGIAAFG